MDIGLEFHKTNSRIRISILEILCVCAWVCANFQAKQIALTFSDQISSKMDLRLEIQETNVGIRIIYLFHHLFYVADMIPVLEVTLMVPSFSQEL